MRLADVDWIPPHKYWHAGNWVYTPQYATFRTDLGRMRIEISRNSRGQWAAQIHIGYSRSGGNFRLSSKFFVSDRVELATILFYTNAKQNPRRKSNDRRR